MTVRFSVLEPIVEAETRLPEAPDCRVTDLASSAIEGSSSRSAQAETGCRRLRRPPLLISTTSEEKAPEKPKRVARLTLDLGSDSAALEIRSSSTETTISEGISDPLFRPALDDYEDIGSGTGSDHISTAEAETTDFSSPERSRASSLRLSLSSSSLSVSSAARGKRTERIAEHQIDLLRHIDSLPIGETSLEDLRLFVETGKRLLAQEGPLDGNGYKSLSHLTDFMDAVLTIAEEQSHDDHVTRRLENVFIPEEVLTLYKAAAETGIPVRGAQKKIGHGQFGTVYHIVDSPFVCKDQVGRRDLSSEEHWKSICREAAFTLILSKETGIPAYYVSKDSETEQFSLYMKKVDGIETKSGHLFHVTKTLVALETLGFVHADIKGANVLGRSLLDMGTMHVKGKRGDEHLGTQFYFAPWMHREPRVGHSHEADMWAYGAAIFKELSRGREFVQAALGKDSLTFWDLCGLSHFDSQEKIDTVIDAQPLTPKQKAFFKFVMRPTAEETPSASVVIESHELAAFLDELNSFEK